MTDLKALIRDVPDHPRPGILFKDITPLLKDPAGFRTSVRKLCASIRAAGCSTVAAIESRGFLFGAAVAVELGLGFVPIRKPGKLPYKTIRETYALEYGSDAVEVHVDSFEEGAVVALVDDLLATGGTMAAACRLVEKLGAKVGGCFFVIELSFLKGRNLLKPYNISSVMTF